MRIYKYWDATFAKVDGGMMFEKNTRRADCANKRRIYKYWDATFAKVECCVKLGCATVYF